MMNNFISVYEEARVGAWARVANLVIDIIAIYAILFVLAILLLVMSELGINEPALWLGRYIDEYADLSGFIAMYAYYAVMETTTQRTIGKMITGTIVVNRYGEKPSVKSVLGRSLCRLFTIEVLSFLTSYPRGFHDRASDTYVVNKKKFDEIANMQSSIDEIGITTDGVITDNV